MALSHDTFETARTVPVHRVTGGDDAPGGRLVVVLHGLMQRAGDLAAALAPLATPGQTLLVPEGLSRSLPRPGAPRAGASWSTGDDAALDLADNLRYLDALLEHERALRQPSVLDLVGFSQGGLMAARWVAARAHPWRRVVLWASLVPADVAPADLRSGLGEAELVVALGDRDPLLSAAVRERALGRLDALGRPWRLHRFDGGHAMAPGELGRVLS